AHGDVVHLFERDCSLQRRHQKVIEESPAPGLDEATRTAVCEAAVRAARAVDYVGAGTVEFIADASEGLRVDRICFMEMNTRLQVEHPVTEAITGLDLVEWQLRVASGEPLPLAQQAITRRGHAVEARLYAENPTTGFLPSVGRLDHLMLPDTVRVDSGVSKGGEVTSFYDPMIAKLIVHAATREAALAELADACAGVECWPVRTNAGFLTRLLEHPDFIAGQVDTGFIESRLEALTTPAPPSDAALAAAGSAAASLEARNADPASPWIALSGFRTNAEPQAEIRLFHAGAAVVAPLNQVVAPRSVLAAGDSAVVVFEGGEALLFAATSPAWDVAEVAGGDGRLTAPLPGKVVAVSAAPGQSLKRGETVLVLEAMKMEHALTAPFDAVLESISVKAGDQVTEGAVLANLAARA
ncbi:MAG: biotin/lipoyl-containing protein, partial [Phenylobacterium sp.]|uniref:ATP-binding protein n=1 Tax=Phenylobacterium sp. TaxID=1871053 RepID=UPI002732530F